MPPLKLTQNIYVKWGASKTITLATNLFMWLTVVLYRIDDSLDC